MQKEAIKDFYRNKTAAHRMIAEVPTARPNDTIKSVNHRVQTYMGDLHTVDYIYVLDTKSNLVGVFSIKELFTEAPDTKVKTIMKTKFVSVTPDTDLEKAADLAVKHSIKAIPVTQKKKFLGVVPVHIILNTLNRALREDVLHLAGIHKAHLKYENTLTVPLFRGVLHRLPWLLIGLVGIILSAMFISVFEDTLQKYVILAFFIPAIVYMSDALGTQHQTLLIRDLAIIGKELNIKKYLLRQMTVGSVVGLLVSAIVFIAIILIWQQPRIALIIAIAMFAALFITSFSALTVTFLIDKLKFDPAIAGGPFATILSDVTSILIYFFVAYILL